MEAHRVTVVVIEAVSVKVTREPVRVLDLHFIEEKQRVNVSEVLIGGRDHLTMSSTLKGGLNVGGDELEAGLLDEAHREAKRAAMIDALAELVDELDLRAVSIERRRHSSLVTGTSRLPYASILFVTSRRGKILKRRGSPLVHAPVQTGHYVSPSTWYQLPLLHSACIRRTARDTYYSQSRSARMHQRATST